MADILLERILGKPADKRPDKTIASIESQSIMLEKQMQQKYAKANEMKKQAGVYYNNKQQSRAINTLKMSKTIEHQAEALSRQLLTLEQLKLQIDQANVMKPTIQVIKTAKSTMKDMLKDMDVNDVEDLMHDMNVNFEDMDDISKALSNPLEGSNVFDDEQLMDELEDMKSEFVDKELSQLEQPRNATREKSASSREPKQADELDELNFEPGTPKASTKKATNKETKQPAKKASRERSLMDELAEELYL